MVIHNRTVFDIPLTWNRMQFESTRNKYRVARKLIESSINVQFEKQMKGVFSHNIEIEENINEINQHLLKYHDKLRVLDNMLILASQSLRTYFDQRMENVRAIVNEHCNIIQEIIREEAEHWKEVHSIMDQNLLNPGDIRSRNNFPRSVQKSPSSHIQTINEEDEEHVSKLLNSKTLTPLLTQMIRKSRAQSKRLTIVPSIKIHVPIEQEMSIPRKAGEFSMHIIPLSTTRQPLEIVDTTFVVKPEETMIDFYDEPNGTYRAPLNQHYHSHLSVPQPERTLLDSQPHIPARLCFSPTILQDENLNEQSLSDDNEKNNERFKTMIVPTDQHRTNNKKLLEDNRRFGQTFLLDIVKTEQMDHDQHPYIRPTISDDDVLVVKDTNATTAVHILPTKNDPPAPTSNIPVQQELVAAQETVPVKTRKRTTTKTKSKPVIVSARKTRSAAKVIAEREAAAAAIVSAKSSTEKPTENKRKARKRKQSKSIDRLIETSDDDGGENPPTTSSSHTDTNRRKTKRRKKSKTEHHQSNETSDENTDHRARSNSKRKTEKRSKSKRNDHSPEISNDKENSKKKTKKLKEQDKSDNDNDKTTKRKKIKVTINENNENKQTKEKNKKQKSRKTNKDDEEQTSKNDTTRSSAKRNHRVN